MLKPYYKKNILEAGTDEVGRGCIAGPVVAAAVILPDIPLHPLLNDSKLLKAEQREMVETWVKENALCYAIAEQSPEIIDHINILNASIQAMHEALSNLSIRPEHILVDGNRFHPYAFIPFTCVVKGDQKYASIAAASVLAKCYRDRLMRQLSLNYPQYAWNKNMGYPTIHHKMAVARYGVSPYHRLSFKMN